MGWLFKPADTKHNTRLQLVIDDINFSDDTATSKVIYGKQNGSVCYLAVNYKKHATGEEITYGLVALTAIDNRDFCNFGTKYISEDMGPNYFGAPKRLINLLSPTQSEYANNWRQECLANVGRTTKRAKDAEILRNLPLDTVIRVNDPSGTIVTPYIHQGKRCYKIVDRWARLSVKYILNYGFEVESHK